MPPAQPSCLLQPNSLHSCLWFHNKMIFEEPSGKGKNPQQICIHRTLNSFSPTQISSVLYNTWKEGVFIQNHCLLVYMHPKRIPENTCKGFKGSQQDTSCGRRCFWGTEDAELFLLCIRLLRTSADPAGIILVFQVSFMGFIIAVPQKKSLSVHEELQVTNSRDSFSN